MRRILVLAATLIAAWASISQAGLITQSGARHYAAAAGGGDNTPVVSRYSLEILTPKATGSVPSGLDSGNVVYYAYPSLTYSIRAAAIGGAYPYTWSLSNAPGGMSINASTGEITWTNPTTDATDIQITVTDSSSATDSETYSVDVTTTGWFFVDGTNDGSGDTGAIDAPFDSLLQLYNASTSGGRVYFRAGTYTPAGIPTTNGTGGAGSPYELGEERIEWGSGRACNWLAYPGDTRPTVDFEYTGDGFPYNEAGESKPRLKMGCEATAFIGLKFYRAMTMAFQLERNATTRRGVYVWNNIFDTQGPGINGGNSGFIMFVGLEVPGFADRTSYGDVIIGNDFSNSLTGTGNSGLKLYSLRKILIEDNDFTTFGTGENEAVAIKGGIQDFTVRGNRFSGIGAIAIGGNMNCIENDPDNGACVTNEETDGDVFHNYVADAGTSAFDVGHTKIRPVGRVDIARNTFVGRVRIQNLVTADGPWNFAKNAIENSDSAETPWSFYQDASVTDTSRATFDDDEKGTNVVDGSGNLIDTAKTGTHGHVIP